MPSRLPDAQLSGRVSNAISLLADNSVEGATVKQSSGGPGSRAAKQERVAGVVDSRRKVRKQNFKTKSWYAAAASKMSAVRITPSPGLQETRAPPLGRD